MKIIKIPNKKSFTLVEILDLANMVDEDRFLAAYYTKEGKPKKGNGDTLAQFIVAELIATFSPDADKKSQLLMAMQAVESAKDKLADLKDHLEGIHDAC